MTTSSDTEQAVLARLRRHGGRGGRPATPELRPTSERRECRYQTEHHGLCRRPSKFPEHWPTQLCDFHVQRVMDQLGDLARGRQ